MHSFNWDTYYMFTEVKREHILIPAEALSFEDWTDQELVFLSLMAYIHNTQPKEDLYTEFNMYAKDFYSLLHIQRGVSVAGEQLLNIKRMYRIGLVDQYNVYIQARPGIYEEYTGQNLNVPVVKEAIESVQALRTYSYLCGKLANTKNIVNEFSYRTEEEDTVHPYMQWAFRNSYNT